MGKIDHEAVLRARVFLLGSGGQDPLEVLHAHRVLAEVSPKAYLPKLVESLVSMWFRTDPQVAAAFAAEAVEAARRIDYDDEVRERWLFRALNAHQKALFDLGRREEGRAAAEELARIGDGRRLGIALAEEGRFREAAELEETAVRDGMPVVRSTNMLAWAANLDAAGLHEKALGVFGELVDETRRETAEQHSAPAVLVCELVHLSRMCESAGRRAEAVAARREALKVLEEQATTDEPKGWGELQDRWATLFLLWGRADEPAPTATAPLPPFGRTFGWWSRDAHDAYLDALPRLEEEAALLRESGRLPELVDIRRRISCRLVRRDAFSGFVEQLRPHFDEGVALSRRLTGDPGRLARALTDRSMFRLAAGAREAARADLAEADALLDAR
ncbi:hypothetical protein ACGFMM_26240 [Streptomyces sp. NPDC048604]|uniref:hypothetical protein n=1 Tax=Streptomyces sp. NPDC048604 TaxID=3365578 RepID=UPI003710FFD1